MELLKNNTKEEDLCFRVDRCLDNLNKIKTLIKIFIVYLTWVAILNGLISCQYDKDLKKQSVLIIVYIIFGCLNIIFYFLANNGIKKINKNDNKVAKYEVVVVSYTSVVLFIGCIISLNEQEVYGHLMVFMIYSLVCMCYFNLNFKQSFIPFVTSVLILLIGLPYFQQDNKILISHCYNLLLFVPVTYSISRIVYKDYKQKYLSIQMLEREMKTNISLNKELEQANHILNKLASVDALTGISNRRGLTHYLEITLESCVDENAPFAAILVDIDCFKEYNDNYGHNKGDEVLVSVAAKLSEIAQKYSCFCARWGGEEFIIVLCGATLDAVNMICQDVATEIIDLKIIHEYSQVSQYITVSAGACSMIIKNKEDFATCIECTDKALYYAKQAGRNNYKTFNISK